MASIQGREHLTQFADSLPVIVWTARADGEMDFANEGFTRFTGISLEHLLAERNWASTIHGEDLVAAQRIWNESIATGRTYQAELRIRRHDGAYRWHLVRATPIRAADNRVVKWHGIAIDINDRNESEAKAQRLAEQLTNTLESITDAFLTFDHQWCFTYINSEAERLLQRDRKELRGKNLWEEYPEALGTAFEHHYRAAMQDGKKVSFEAFFPPLNTWFSVNAYPSSEGLAVYFQNIENRRRAEEQLKLLETCVENMNDIVIITEAEPQDEPGPRIVFVNNAFSQRTGYSREEVVGRSPRFLQGKNTQSDELKRIRQAIRQQLPVRAELLNYTKAGEEYWLELDLVPVANNQGAYTHWVAVERDISERKTRDMERRQIADLEQSRQIAELANQAKTQFLATMSHEVRTPISGVMSMVEVLQQTDLKKDQREIVDVIRESAASLLEIVDDILDFSKIEAGKLELELAPLSVEKLLKGVCSLLDRFALNKGVELTCFFDPQIPEVLVGDELRLRQILLNLINNAIKFSSSKTRLGKVNVRAELIAQDQREAQLAFYVIDNGIGMSQATVSRLFTPFMQADVSTTRHFGGTGLGLSISHHLVDLMGGQIAVHSNPDQGSHFSVTLKLVLSSDVIDNRRAMPQLPDVFYLVLGEPERLGDDLAVYLRWANVTTIRVSDISAVKDLDMLVGAALESLICILDAQDPNAWLEALSATSCSPAACVVIERGQRRAPRRINANQVSIDGNILDRHSFFCAIAMAMDPEQDKHYFGFQQRSGADVLDVVTPARQLKGPILVAEDNETNQKVISRQLSLLGYAVDIANNGCEALDMWQKGNYRMIFTDLHMPKMDGYELVQQIRRREGTASGSAIVGLSANALQGEDRRCLAIGMNDYLVKPVSLTKLKAVIERWLPDDATSLQGSSVLGPLDVNVLISLIGEDPTILKEFLLAYGEDLLRLTESAQRFYRAHHFADLAAVAHKLKSSSRSVGALNLGDLCEKVEYAAKRNEPEGLDDLLAHLQAESKRVDTFLQQTYRISNQ